MSPGQGGGGGKKDNLRHNGQGNREIKESMIASLRLWTCMILYLDMLYVCLKMHKLEITDQFSFI